MTSKELSWLTRLEKEVDKHWDELTEWEQRFMESILERFRRWGMKTKISPKEWGIITRISDKAIL
jgi:hypothetical protein